MNAVVQRDALIVEYLPQIRKEAAGLHAKLPPYVDRDDLVSNGVLGFMKAIGRYNSDELSGLWPFARKHVRGAMLDSLRQGDWASRDTRNYLKLVETVGAEAAVQGLTERQKRSRAALPTAGPLSLSHQADTSQPPLDCEDPRVRPDVEAESNERSRIIKRGLRSLPSRHRTVMLGLYWRDQPPKEIGKKLGVSPLRISQIKAVAIMKLHEQFSSMGVTAGAI